MWSGDSLLQDYLQHFQRHCVAYPGLLSTLDRLKQRGVALGLISNGYGQFQSDNLRALGIEPFFDEILISEWEELRKPDPAIFHRALSRLGISAENALFVGDHPDNDIRASQAAGMKAVWKRNESFDAVPEAAAVIDDLAELLPIVFPSR